MAQHRVVLFPVTESAGDHRGGTAIAGGGERENGFELVFEEQPIGGSAGDATGEPPRQHIGRFKAADAVFSQRSDPRFDNLPRDKRPETGLPVCSPAWICSPTCGR